MRSTVFAMLVLLLWQACSIWVLAADGDRSTVDVGTRKQLLVDDFVVAELSGVTRELGTVEKANGGEPIFTDGWFYGTVLHDDGRFKLLDARGESGAYVGKYRISFYPALKSGAKEDDPAAVVSTPKQSSVPAIYMDAGSSPVIATVPEGGGRVEVQLTKTGKGAKATTTPHSPAP